MDDLIHKPSKFDPEFERVVNWAENRAAINEKLDSVFGATEVLLELRRLQQLVDGGIIRVPFDFFPELLCSNSVRLGVGACSDRMNISKKAGICTGLRLNY